MRRLAIRVSIVVYLQHSLEARKISEDKEPDVRWQLVKVPIRTSSNPQNREPDNLGESALRGRGSLLSR